MPYINREDGERFVVPSYRDVLSVKQKSQLKKEILALSQNYGEYITLQKKAANQYEVAFSPDTGYLLGETIWHYFKKPQDLIYCEAQPNTTEAILVIVKSGSVYLDGLFPVESIPEELVIFLTQANNFEIYTYGDVPISPEPEAGKFTFEAASVKSFTKLETPAFPELPLLKIYQFQLVDAVLRSHGIGVFPFRLVMLFVVFLGLCYFVYSYFAREEVPIIREIINPYQNYLNALHSPDPEQVLENFMDQFTLLVQIPGWKVNSIKAAPDGTITASIVSIGGSLDDLYVWSNSYKVNVEILTTGIQLKIKVNNPRRPIPSTIMNLNKVLASMVDRMQRVYPGNNMSLENIVKHEVYSQAKLTIKFQDISPAVLSLIARQLSGLPLVIGDINLTLSGSSLSGTISVEAFGS